MTERDSRKEQLRSELASARSALSSRGIAVGDALDFKARIRKNVARNPVAWLGGAVLVGFILSRLPARKTKVRARKGTVADVDTAAKTGLLMTVAKIAFDVSRPALMKLAMTQIQPILEKAVERWQRRR
jgi:hypothetical protein